MFQPAPIFTEEMNLHKNRLRLLLVIGVILGLAKFPFSPDIALNDLIALVFLWCASSYANHCLLVFFMIITLFATFSYIVMISILLQRVIVLHENPFKVDSAPEVFFHRLIIATAIFDFFLLKFSFEAYKCFKAVAYGEVGRVGQVIGRNPRFTRESDEDIQVNTNNPAGNFQRQGMRIGG